MCVYTYVGKSREAERKRINKELANIRSKFKGKGNVLIVTPIQLLICYLQCVYCTCAVWVGYFEVVSYTAD